MIEITAKQLYDILDDIKNDMGLDEKLLPTGLGVSTILKVDGKDQIVSFRLSEYGWKPTTDLIIKA